MDSFLRLIAKTYVDSGIDELSDYCFVFPNRRSGAFFRQYLRENASGISFIMPDIVTVNELAANVSDLTEATRDEALFVLFKCYKSFMPESEAPDFDKFIFWGTMLLNDFDDVDKNLVDAESLFVNIHRWRQIKSFYLTDEQVEIIERYWGEKVLSANDVDDFWSHIEKSSSSTADKKPSNDRFLKLWEIMAPLYHDFIDSMRMAGIATKGMMMRHLAESVRKDGVEAVLPAKRYIFIGFDIPSGGEIAIFKRLKAVGKADFYWDFNTPVMADKSNRITRMMLNLRHDFPSMYDLDEEPITSFPEISIIGVPSETGQTKLAGETLAGWVEKGIIRNPKNAINTAVVLPDESLFIPMVHALPDSITTKNVTMGFPLRFTPVASLVSQLTRMHLRARLSHGTPEYFYEDVETVLAHPIIRLAAPEECKSLLSKIRLNRLYNVSADIITEEYPVLQPIFVAVPVNESVQTAVDYITGVLDFLEKAIEGHDNMKMEEFFIRSCREALSELTGAVVRFDIGMRESTFLHLLDRMLFNTTVRFKGEPLQGLQIMGVLETRSLDFDNVIIMSMNERIFPKKSYIRSFIPDTLRKCYGLPTPDIAEAQYCYYFYWILSRAKHVTLFYDTRATSGQNNEMSRFMTQLIYLYPSAAIKHSSGIYAGVNRSAEPIVLERTDEIRKQLKRFQSQGEDALFLSASALKTYLKCPLQFCLSYVLRLRIEDELNDFMEASTLGSIVHEVFEKLYGSLRKTSDGYSIVTKEILDDWLKNDLPIRRLITRSTNKLFMRMKPSDDRDRELTGEALVIGNAILHIVRSTLKQERQFCPFKYVAGEEKMQLRWEVNPDLVLNFKQVIDRIDIVGDRLRIVDYKTGTEAVNFIYMDSMFTPGSESDKLSIFQVILYCLLYAQEKNYDKAIQPYIYTLKSVTGQGLQPIKYNRKVLDDYKTISENFKKSLNALLVEIFDSDKPFIQTQSEKNCKFCNFKQFCGRDK